LKATISPTNLSGVYIIESSKLVDQRGFFIKTFHEDFYKDSGLNTNYKEEYFSLSKKNVIRGMHFQTPPHEHEKIVYCIKGKVLDVIVDLRVSSPAYGCFFSVELSGSDGKIIYIPKGFAHGFCSLEDDSIMMYKVSTVYSPENDSGIRWDTFDFNWPVEKPLLSERDRSFPSLNNFESPF
jgi:dTDP-4-dehydrorhamnose 3,5-epimerase